ncbi:MAG: diaminopimelate decarboxylase [Leptospiraceae bacterium]|nr:diaminopimelate decarboxylase [Leptospiraceae bacterium]
MHSGLEYKEQNLHFGGQSLQQIAALQETPFYIYNSQSILSNIEAWQAASDPDRHHICYAVKANSNLAILQIMARQGLGADIVSGGELLRCLQAGIPANRIVYSGVGKTAAEIALALEAGILLFSVESRQELEQINECARRAGVLAAISMRVNPDVDAATHPYISTGLTENKFGIHHDQALAVFQMANRLEHVRISGIGFHIGSQLTSLDGFAAAAQKVRELIPQIESECRLELEWIDCGGGLGIQYNAEEPPAPADYMKLMDQILGIPGKQLAFEPGRHLVGNAGLLVSRVLYTKENGDRRFIICDAAMNDLIRPALYQGYHAVYPVTEHGDPASWNKADLVGPVCESGDFIARQRPLPNLQAGDLVAIHSTGAYGFVMASNYNSRMRAAELLITPEGDLHLARRRETYADLIRGEQLL